MQLDRIGAGGKLIKVQIKCYGVPAQILNTFSTMDCLKNATINGLRLAFSFSVAKKLYALDRVVPAWSSRLGQIPPLIQQSGLNSMVQALAAINLKKKEDAIHCFGIVVKRIIFNVAFGIRDFVDHTICIDAAARHIHDNVQKCVL